MEKDENSSLGKLVASRENYGWTENDLLYSIADTIINSEGSSTTTARATNVRGKNVEINAANAGSVGEVGETVTGRLSDEDETKRLTLLKALSRATSVTSRARTEWFPSRSRSPSLSRRRGTSP